ncbi:hypothetical protein ACF073_37210 [Streptomyces sp. NPDC015171]|uniref:hypothetical protein n=1 Tax=Streptomyces sp. NPDC015171 TaxID=3364945 RepID=UPI003700E5C4
MEERIAKGRAAIGRFADLPDVEWEAIRAAYQRPPRSVLGSYRALAGEMLVVAFITALVSGWFAVATTSWDMAQKGRGQVTHADWVAVAYFTVVVTAASVFGLVMRRVSNLRQGVPAVAKDEVLSAALAVLPACAEVASASAGHGRHTALGTLHELLGTLNTALAKSARRCNRISHFTANRRQVIAHTRKVRVKLLAEADQLTADRATASGNLARFVVHIAVAHARSEHSALLPAADLPADPGASTPIGPFPKRLLVLPSLAATLTLTMLVMLGTTDAALVFAPLSMFLMTLLALLTTTGNLAWLRALTGVVFARESPEPNNTPTSPSGG